MSNAYINFTFESKTDWVKKINECQKEIKRIKEEYMMLQNASDKVEEEKDRKIERLNNIIKKVREYIDKELDIEKICRQEKSLTICKKELLEILDKVDKEKE